MVWRTKVQAKVQGCSFLHFLFFSIVFFYTCHSNSMKMEEMLWIEDIVESTKAPPFFTNSRVDMASFVDLYNMVVKRISALPSAWNGGE